jgi:hypothetical protein
MVMAEGRDELNREDLRRSGKTGFSTENTERKCAIAGRRDRNIRK